MTSFALYALAAALVALVWTLVVAKTARAHRSHLGVAGAWMATLVLTAHWQLDALPQLLHFIQLILLVWLASVGLVIVDACLAWSKRPPHWRVLAALALLTVAIHVVAGLHFLWLATVSPGGV